MKIIDLITDAGTGQLSHTKLWTNIAYAAATVAFLRISMFSDAPSSPDIWLVYLGVVGASGVSSKFLSLKYGARK